MSPFGMWREWFMAPTQRCLIPFTAFAEAEGAAGAMTKTWIRVADQPLAAWAGLWRPTDEWGDCYTGVMVDATAELFVLHARSEERRVGTGCVSTCISRGSPDP